MPDRRVVRGLAAVRWPPAFGAFLAVLGWAQAARAAPGVLPVLAWLALPLLLGGASLVAAVAVDALLRGRRRRLAEFGKVEE